MQSNKEGGLGGPTESATILPMDENIQIFVDSIRLISNFLSIDMDIKDKNILSHVSIQYLKIIKNIVNISISIKYQ